MNSTLNGKTVGCQITMDRGPDGVQAMTVTQSNLTTWIDSCLPIYSKVKNVEITSSYLLKFFNRVKTLISGIFHLGAMEIDEQLLAHDPWLEVYRTRKDF